MELELLLRLKFCTLRVRCDSQARSSPKRTGHFLKSFISLRLLPFRPLICHDGLIRHLPCVVTVRLLKIVY